MLGLQWGGGSLKSGVLRREYARSRHYGVFYLQNLKVFILRILKNSVGKVAKNAKGQFLVTLPRESFDLGQNVALCLQNLTISESRILKNSVGKVDHFAILIVILAIFQNCDTVDLDSHQDFVIFSIFQNCDTVVPHCYLILTFCEI